MYFNGTKCSSILLGCLLSLSLSAKDVKETINSEGLRKPLCFIENKGQLADQDNHPRNDIQYKLSTPGMNLFVGNAQLHYQFRQATGKLGTAQDINAYRMDVTLLGANQAAKAVPADKQAYYELYYLGKNGDNSLTAQAWNKVVYKDVYPNIDWVLYVKDNQVEYDFIVHPGGNIHDIQLQYSGATALHVTSDGGIYAETPMGTIQEKSPVSFETATGKAVASKFVLKDNIISFETGSYQGSLTIDPYLNWSTYYGGPGEDVATSVVGSSIGEIYICGYTTSASGIATAGAFFGVGFVGGTAAFVAKFNSLGALQWASYYGVDSITMANGLAIESTGANIYMAGQTSSTAGSMADPSPGAYQTMNRGKTDGFLLKLNSAGALQWSTYFGGAKNDYINAVACDASNYVYITGQTESNTFIATGGSYQPALSGTDDAFLSKFDNTGALQWSTYYGGTGLETGTGIACDASGYVIITGQTTSVGSMASAGAFHTSLSGISDAFVAKFYTSTGLRYWGTYIGGTGTEQGNGVACDANNNIAVIGNTTSATGTGLATANAFQTAYGGGSQDAFITYITPAGIVNWSTYYGGTQPDYGQGVCFDPFNNVVVAGGTFSTSGIASAAGSGIQTAIGGDYDAFAAKFNNFGQQLWGSYFGGVFYDYANAVTCSGTDQITIAGFTTSTGLYGANGIATAGTHQTANAGGTYDAFVSQFHADTFMILSQPYIDTVVCAGGTFNVAYTVFSTGSAFQPDNVFTVQMSDATGSFAAPSVIGSAAGTTTGSVSCIVPAAASGTGYRIRILSSDPAFTSPADNLNINVLAGGITASTASAKTPTCVGSTIYLHDTATLSISSYTWAGPAGFTSAVQNPTIPGAVAANAGTYTVTAVHNGCAAGVATTTVVVNSVIPPTPADSSSGPVNCAGNAVYLFAKSDTTAAVTYHWTGPSGFVSTLQNPTIPISSTGNSGTYTLTDTLAGCPSLPATLLVPVYSVTTTALKITSSPGDPMNGPGDTICAGSLVNFVATPVNGGLSPTYQWMVVTTPVVGAVSSTWASPSLTNSEVVYCVLASSIQCPLPVHANSNTITMDVITNSPIVYIAANTGPYVATGTDVTFSAVVYNGGIAPSYQWQMNHVNIPGATNATYTDSNISSGISIDLVLTSNMECAVPDTTVYSNTVTIQTNVGVTNISPSLESVGLYPNPNNGSFTVKGSLQSSSNVSVEVCNLLGQVIYSGDAATQNNQLNKTITLEKPPGGIYFLRITQDGESKVFRFSVLN